MPESDAEGSPSSWTPERLKRGALVLIVTGVSLLYCLGIGGLVLRQRMIRPPSQTPTASSTPRIGTSTPLPAISIPGLTLEPTPTQGTLVFPTPQPTPEEPTPSPDNSETPEVTVTLTTTGTPTPSPSPTTSATLTMTPTETATPTFTPTVAPTETATETPTEIPTTPPDTTGSASTASPWVFAPRG